MATTRIDRFTHRHGRLPARVTVPGAGHGPALVLLPEIFGIDEQLTATADRLARRGYVVVCPDLYWRIEPDVALPHDRGGLRRALELMTRLDLSEALADCVVTLHHARCLPEVRGLVRTGPDAPVPGRYGDLGAGLAGFGLGGSLAFLAAAECKPDVVVAFDGSAVPDHVDLLDLISCPVQLHFGGADPLISRDRVAVVEAAATARYDVEVHVHEDDTGDDRSPARRRADAADRAWSQAAAFLARHLPVPAAR